MNQKHAYRRGLSFQHIGTNCAHDVRCSQERRAEFSILPPSLKLTWDVVRLSNLEDAKLKHGNGTDR
jgi:hypothetical protein